MKLSDIDGLRGFVAALEGGDGWGAWVTFEVDLPSEEPVEFQYCLTPVGSRGLNLAGAVEAVNSFATRNELLVSGHWAHLPSGLELLFRDQQI